MDAHISRMNGEAEALCKVIDQIHLDFVSGAELAAAGDLIERCTAIAESVRSKQLTVGEHIQALASSNTELQAQRTALACEAAAAYSSKKAELESELQNVNSSVQALEDKHRYAHPRKINNRTLAARCLDTRADALKEEALVSEANRQKLLACKAENDQLRSKLALYTHITQVDWAPECTTACAVGSMLGTGGSGVHSFSFPAAEFTHFQAVNRFWDMMDE